MRRLLSCLLLCLCPLMLFAAEAPRPKVGLVLSGGNVDLDALPWMRA